jgi:hypothetical protein
MMNARTLLASLTALCGATPEQIAEGSQLPIARVQETMRGWPLRGRQRKALGVYAKALLRQTHADAAKRLALPELQGDANAHRHVRDLEDTYKAAFGIAIIDDINERCERCSCMKALELLGVEPSFQDLYGFMPNLGEGQKPVRKGPTLGDLTPNPPAEHFDASLEHPRPPSRFPEWANDHESQALLRLVEVAGGAAMQAKMRMAKEGATRPELQTDPAFAERWQRVCLAHDIVLGRLFPHTNGGVVRRYRPVECVCKRKGKQCR